MVINCSQKQIAAHNLFHLPEDKLHKMMGLHLEEDDHFLVLKDKENIIARWNATGVTAKEIQDTANSYIVNNCSQLELGLLRFWGRHPHAKLSLYTIATAMDTGRINLRYAITALVEKEILKEQHGDNGLTTYVLTSDLQIQEYIDTLVGPNLSDTSSSKKQINREAVLA